MTMAIGNSKTAFSNSAPAYLVPYLPLRLQRNLRWPCRRPPVPEHTWLGSTSQILHPKRYKGQSTVSEGVELQLHRRLRHGPCSGDSLIGIIGSEKRPAAVIRCQKVPARCVPVVRWMNSRTPLGDRGDRRRCLSIVVNGFCVLGFGGRQQGVGQIAAHWGLRTIRLSWKGITQEHRWPVAVEAVRAAWMW